MVLVGNGATGLELKYGLEFSCGTTTGGVAATGGFQSSAGPTSIMLLLVGGNGAPNVRSISLRT